MPDCRIPWRERIQRVPIYFRVETGMDADMVDACKVIDTIPYIAQRFIYGLSMPSDEAIAQVTTMWEM